MRSRPACGTPAGTLDLMFAYTFSKSIDQSSSLADPINPFNFSLTRALSAWDLTHNLVATYQYQLPFEQLFKRSQGLDAKAGRFPESLASAADSP